MNDEVTRSIIVKVKARLAFIRYKADWKQIERFANPIFSVSVAAS